MAFTEDLSPFFSTDDFAVTATLNGVAVTGIFDASYYEPFGEVEGKTPTFLLPASSASAAAHGQSLVIGATTYKVRGIEPDGTGLVMLRIEEQ